MKDGIGKIVKRALIGCQLSEWDQMWRRIPNESQQRKSKSCRNEI